MDAPVTSRLAACLLATLLVPAAAAAQPLPVVNTPQSAQATLTPQQLDQLVGPVALYPDPLLTDILVASTYPAQVVEAVRFLADPANRSLQGTQIQDAAASHNWDPSVVDLLVFPQVLQMMDGQLEWTEHLGQAFLAQQGDVLGAVQTMRQMAQAAGSLTAGAQDSVLDDGGNILIDPPNAQQVYLPSYDPACVYGYDPSCTNLQGQVGWLGGFVLPYGYRHWGGLDWRNRNVRYANGGARDGGGHVAFNGFDDGQEGPVWQHGGAARGSVRVAAGLEARGSLAERSARIGEHFNYAPAANEPFGAGRSLYRPLSPVHFSNPGPGLRPVVRAGPGVAPPRAGVVAGAHPVGGFHR